MKKIIILLAILAIPTTFADKSSLNIEQYVSSIVDEASTLLSNDKISEAQKISKSSDLMAQNLDLNWMARYSLGRHRKDFNSAQIDQFTKVYSIYIIKTYSDLIRNYKGQKAVIKKVVQLVEGKEYIVKTEVIQSGQSRISVDYLVHDVNQNSKGKPALKISDIITEGVSAIHSQQQEFNSVINSRGFDALITELKQKS
ncbi:MAG: MlaC/ttg2D family ABC transporter substrate-binding protein [Janthinobacterium lividum]